MNRILILAGMTPIPEAMLQQAESYTGSVSNCYFAQGKTPAEFQYSFNQILEENPDAELVVLCDTMQSKPNEIALMSMDRYGRHGVVMVGMNLGMVINAVLMKDQVDSAQQLIESLNAQAKAAIGGMEI